MRARPRILIVEDQPRERDALARLLRTEGYQPVAARNIAEAMPQLQQPLDAVVCDLRIGAESGVELLEHFKSARRTLPFVMVTAFGDIQSAVTAMKIGAEDYLTKPINPDELLILLRRLISPRELDSDAVEPLNGVDRILGSSQLMDEVRERVLRVARSESLVLILGESGTGKELVAAAIHQHSARSSNSYVAFNIAAVPESLIEAELFGNVKGAFTGAEQSRIGRFEAANGGTLFIDEIGDFPLSSQAKLLRVLENLTVNPVGSNEERRVDVRVIAATSRNLSELVASGQFRQDLFYRVNILTIQLPPLRERREDIPRLCDVFLRQSCLRYERELLSVNGDLRDFFLNYEWPGNVRQLRNTIENMVVMNTSNTLSLKDLPAYLSGNPSELSPTEMQGPTNLQDLERRAILAALDRSHGNRTRAAYALGISVRTLQRKLKAWGLASDDEASIEI